MRAKVQSTEEILRLGAVQAAPLLLGYILTRKTSEGELVLKIVETEAYHQNDPASHSCRGLTARTAPMFQAGGTIYVYFTYGIHYSLNIVVGQKGVGEAVLLRAGEPLRGIEIMQKNRTTKNHTTTQNSHFQDQVLETANGPAKLAQALGIFSTELSGKKLGPETLQLWLPAEPIKVQDIVVTPRIGIKQAVDQPWRFYIKNNSFVSRR